jgi:hypothetical protein
MYNFMIHGVSWFWCFFNKNYESGSEIDLKLNPKTHFNWTFCERADTLYNYKIEHGYSLNATKNAESDNVLNLLKKSQNLLEKKFEGQELSHAQYKKI